jgi:hypothetical protein
MRFLSRRLLTLAATAGVALALVTPSAAFADYYGDETDYAQPTGGPTGTKNVDYFCLDLADSWGVEACYKPYGDYFYVKDTKSDGYAAVAQWHTLGFEGRTGSCVNKLTAGDWGVCNKNLPEGVQVEVIGMLYNNGNPVGVPRGIFTVTT